MCGKDGFTAAVDIFTTHWIFLPYVGHFYHTLDIFTTHWTSLPHTNGGARAKLKSVLELPCAISP
jgi:hypothetical protein